MQQLEGRNILRLALLILAKGTIFSKTFPDVFLVDFFLCPFRVGCWTLWRLCRVASRKRNDGRCEAKAAMSWKSMRSDAAFRAHSHQSRRPLLLLRRRQLSIEDAPVKWVAALCADNQCCRFDPWGERGWKLTPSVFLRLILKISL